MEIDSFWLLTESIDQSALFSGEEELALSPLIAALAALPLEEVRAYEEHLCQMLYKLDGETFAKCAGDSADSADGFLYARCYVVAMGQDHCQMVLSNPEHMPKTLEQWCEALLYVASKAWALQTGRSPEDWDFSASVSYETGSNSSQWPSAPAKVYEEVDPFIEANFQRAVSRAGHSFRSGHYGNVVKLLKQHEALLSQKQRLMLNEASAQSADRPNPSIEGTSRG